MAVQSVYPIVTCTCGKYITTRVCFEPITGPLWRINSVLVPCNKKIEQDGAIFKCCDCGQELGKIKLEHGQYVIEMCPTKILVIQSNSMLKNCVICICGRCISSKRNFKTTSGLVWTILFSKIKWDNMRYQRILRNKSNFMCECGRHLGLICRANGNLTAFIERKNIAEYLFNANMDDEDVKCNH